MLMYIWRDGQIARVNPTWEMTTGYSDAETRRKPLHEFFAPEQSGVIDGIVDDLARSPFPGATWLTLIRKGGSPLTVGMRAGAFNEQGWTRLEFRDMTERAAIVNRLRETIRELDARTALFRAAMDYSPIMIAFHNREGNYIYVSPASRRVIFHDPAALLNIDPFSLIHPNDLALARELFGRFIEQPGKVSGEYVRLRAGPLAGGKPEYVRVYSSGVNLLSDPAIQGFISWTEHAPDWTATGGGANDDPRFSRAWDHGDDYGPDHDDMPERWRE
jgi:PAS domain S-box-containing protein